MVLLKSLLESGLPLNEANDLVYKTNEFLKKFPRENAWQKIVQEILTSHYPSKYPFSIHQLLYKTVYPDWDKSPEPGFIPDENLINTCNLARLMNELEFMNNYSAFHRWSSADYVNFWRTMSDLLKIVFDKPYKDVVDLSGGLESPKWFAEAKMNIVNSCFKASPEKERIAIISGNEEGELTQTTVNELDKLSNRIANSLLPYVKKGDRLAIIMPMTVNAVALYLGIIKAGCVVVSIADSFSAEEISLRMRIVEVKMVFTQDDIYRDGKRIPLYERIIEAGASIAVVLQAALVGVSLKNENRETKKQSLRACDMRWQDFLQEKDNFKAVACDTEDYMNILFSSGTTGEPKAIPWTHTTPLKCASDAYLHHNIQSQDIFCWPSNLGWMMGPWLIFACLINEATLALYDGTPNDENFGRFIQDAKVTLLGVVPTLVKTWRRSRCMEDLDWRSLKLFTSTGECSNTEDMLYLMFLGSYCPIIEYCGGTEIGGAYITGTVIQPSAPAAFTTPALGLDFIILGEDGRLSDKGEVAILPPSVGLSTTLINKDHHEVYYSGMSEFQGRLLRRHGDHLERYPNGYYRALGRSDDTLNLGGIKISSAEIEAVLNRHPLIHETAAVAIEPEKGGGPSQLVIYAVLKSTVDKIGDEDEDMKGFNTEDLKKEMQILLNQHLNPLFKIAAIIILNGLPRTASNKVMRRVLRDQYRLLS